MAYGISLIHRPRVSADGPRSPAPAAQSTPVAKSGSSTPIAKSGSNTPVERITLTLSSEEKARVVAAVTAAGKQFDIDKDSKKILAAPTTMSENEQRVYAMESHRALAVKTGQISTAAIVDEKYVVTRAILTHWKRSGCNFLIRLDLTFTNKGLAHSRMVKLISIAEGDNFPFRFWLPWGQVPALRSQETSPPISAPPLDHRTFGNCDNRSLRVGYYRAAGTTYLLEWDRGTFRFYEWTDG